MLCQKVSGKIYLEPIRRCVQVRTPERLRRLLAPVESLELESISESESDITDPMEEVTKDNILTKKDEIKHLKRHEIHQKMMEMFTDDYKRVMADVRQDMQLGDYYYAERKEDVFAVLEGQIQPAEPSNQAREKKSATLDSVKIPKKESDTSSVSEMSYDYMSGFWRMLKARTDNGKFVVSPGNYNVYEHDTPYWLLYPDVSKEKLETSRQKCKLWLTQQHQ